MKVAGSRDGQFSASFHRDDAGMSSGGEGPHNQVVHRNPIHAALAHGKNDQDSMLGRKMKEIQE